MPRETTSGKGKRRQPAEHETPGAPAGKRSTGEQTFRAVMDGLAKRRNNQKDVVASPKDRETFRAHARNDELRGHAEWSIKQHRAPASSTPYDFLANQYDKQRNLEELAELKLKKTPLDSLHEDDKRIREELKLYFAKAARGLKYEVTVVCRNWSVEAPGAAEAIRTKRHELKERLLAGEKVEDELSKCREIVRAFNCYVLRPKVLSDFASEIQWGGEEGGKEKGEGKGKGKEEGGLAKADVPDWESPLGKHIKFLNQKRRLSYEDLFPKVQDLIQGRWGNKIDGQISKTIDELNKDEQKGRKKYSLDEDNNDRLWALLGKRLDRLNVLRKCYDELNSMDLEALTLPNKLMVSAVKAYIVKQAKYIRILRIDDNRLKPTPREVIKKRVEALKEADKSKLENPTDERIQLIEMMRQFGDRDSEEDMLEIADESIYYFEELKDVTKRTIQAKYVNGLMDAYKKRFPDTDWLYPTESYFRAIAN